MLNLRAINAYYYYYSPDGASGQSGTTTAVWCTIGKLINAEEDRLGLISCWWEGK